jgi:hypothetical protein
MSLGMALATLSVLEFDQAVDRYSACLHGGGEPDAGKEAEQTYMPLRAEARWVHACLDHELVLFQKAGGDRRGTPKGPPPADCRAFRDRIEKGGAELPGSSSDFSEPRALASGSWRYRLLRDETRAWIEIDNSSKDVLVCQIDFELDRHDSKGTVHEQGRTTVYPAGLRWLRREVQLPQSGAVKADVVCTSRPPPENCKYEVVFGLTQKEETLLAKSGSGVVDLEFNLSNVVGAPSDVHVLKSSESQQLDQEAVKLMGRHVVWTNCTDHAYKSRITFR